MRMEQVTEEQFLLVMEKTEGKASGRDVGATHGSIQYSRQGTDKMVGLVSWIKVPGGERYWTWQIPVYLYEAYLK